jgi:hypothetical protein
MLCAASPAQGQAAGAEAPVRRVEVSVGAGWFGGAELGARDAELRQNVSPPQPLRLFSSGTRLSGTPTLDVTVGYAFNRRFGVEGGVALSHPEIRTSLSDDAEGASPITVAERIDQYVVEARLFVLLEEARLGQRTIPFVAGGVGYLRQLHEGLTLVEEGHVYHIGGGLRHWLLTRRGGFVKAAGLRADARLNLLVAGISFDDGARPHGSISGAVVVVF